MTDEFWSIPREWVGETCCIIGGGPSFDPMLAPILPGRVIAINSSVKCRPNADVLFWADPQWALAHPREVALHSGKYKITRRRPPPCAGDSVKLVGWVEPFPKGKGGVRRLSNSPKYVGGYCSGGNAINIAYLFGVATTLLLGFDMQRVDGKDYYDGRCEEGKKKIDNYSIYIKHIEALAEDLNRNNVQVYNCSKNSKLTCFEYKSIETFLR
jgi:hypothetical protein